MKNIQFKKVFTGEHFKPGAKALIIHICELVYVDRQFFFIFISIQNTEFMHDVLIKDKTEDISL